MGEGEGEEESPEQQLQQRQLLLQGLLALARRSDAGAEAAVLRSARDALAKAAAYEDPAALAAARAAVPLARLRAAADAAAATSAAYGEDPPLGADAALAEELLRWFKLEFFTWVDAPPCARCGGATAFAGAAPASAAEVAAGRASRTELFACSRCGAATRFPRLNCPAALLATRRGRCGEWANAFGLCLRAAGLEPRLVADAGGDHVWCEAWVGGRWVHLDPCEGAMDAPLLYEAGWGRAPAHVVAAGRGGAADATRRYSGAPGGALLARRAAVGEGWLAAALALETAAARAALPPGERALFEGRDAADAVCAAPAAPGALPARQSGSAAWAAARGEGGGGGGCEAPPAPARARPPTRLRAAGDAALAAAQPGRVAGGALRASGENPPAETADRLADGDARTKWLDLGAAGGRGAWAECVLPPRGGGGAAAAAARYALVAAADAPERDPAAWVLGAWVGDGGRGGRWAALDARRGAAFAARGARREFAVAPRARRAARRWRLRVEAVAAPAAANSVQLAGWELFSSSSSGEV